MRTLGDQGMHQDADGVWVVDLYQDPTLVVEAIEYFTAQWIAKWRAEHQK